jgi:hypothetical protein
MRGSSRNMKTTKPRSRPFWLACICFSDHQQTTRCLYSSIQAVSSRGYLLRSLALMTVNNPDGKEPPFTALPEEICIGVIEELDMPSMFALSRTCQRFRRLSDPSDECRRHQLEAYLIQVQAFPRWPDGFACFSCLRVLPRGNFSNGQTKSKRGRNGSQ